jgi:UDP-3-O-[3-hydroxymyristoyl] glucosamine N-acyltransferase
MMDRLWRLYPVRMEVGGVRVEALSFGPLNRALPRMLTWLDSKAYLGLLAKGVGAFVFCTQDVAEEIAALGSTPLPVDCPRDSFWRTLIARAQGVPPPAPDVHPSARLHPTVVLGCPAFKVVELDGRRFIAPQLGGISIGAGVSVAANSLIQAGFFGEDTAIGPETYIDSFCHIGHSMRLGERCTVTAGTIFGGWVDVGAHSRVVGSNVRDGVRIGRDAVVGWGSNVVGDVPAGAKVKGNPARIFGWGQGYGPKTD